MASLAPISEAQLIANRENAKRSTGPATPEGKSRTRLNGLRHGLTGQTALLPEEDREAYERHHADFFAELAPEGPSEIQLARSIADDYWRLNRIKAIEDNIFALGIEALAEQLDPALAQARTYLDQAREINLLSLYEQRLNRAVHKKHIEFAELQRLRKVARAARRHGNGFGFSNDRIAAPPPYETRAVTPTTSSPAPFHPEPPEIRGSWFFEN
jgi:hypothetical protein